MPDFREMQVGHFFEDRGGELARVLLAGRAFAIGLAAEGRLEDDVVGEHLGDAVDVMRVPHRIELPDESLAVETRHANLPSANRRGPQTSIPAHGPKWPVAPSGRG